MVAIYGRAVKYGRDAIYGKIAINGRKSITWCNYVSLTAAKDNAKLSLTEKGDAHTKRDLHTGTQEALNDCSPGGAVQCSALAHFSWTSCSPLLLHGPHFHLVQSDLRSW